MLVCIWELVQRGSTIFASLLSEDIATDPAGVFAGAQLGDNFQVGNLVFGPEVSMSWSGIGGGDVASTVVPPITFGGGVDWFGVVGGRLGFAAERVHIFLDCGYALGSINTSSSHPLLPDGIDDDINHHGYALGRPTPQDNSFQY